MAAFDRNDVIQWAHRLAGTDQIRVETCRPGEKLVVSHGGNDGDSWIHSDVGRVAYPATVWGQAAETAYRQSRTSHNQWSSEDLSGTTAPTLIKVHHRYYGPHGSDRRWYASEDDYFVLYLPEGESQADFERRERREFAASVRQSLLEAGLDPALLGPLFRAAGVSKAHDAFDLAQLARQAAGEDALRILQNELHAPYGRVRRLDALATAEISWSAQTAAALNRHLAGAVIVLGGNPDEMPPAPEAKVFSRGHQTPPPAPPRTDLASGLAALQEQFGPQNRR